MALPSRSRRVKPWARSCGNWWPNGIALVALPHTAHGAQPHGAPQPHRGRGGGVRAVLLQPLEEEGVGLATGDGLRGWGQGTLPRGGLAVLTTVLGEAGDRGVPNPGAKCPLHQLLPFLLLLGQLPEQPGGRAGTQTGSWGHGVAPGGAQRRAKPYLSVSVRRRQSCATSAEPPSPGLGPVLSPELVLLVLSHGVWLLGTESLGGVGSSLSPVSLSPASCSPLAVIPRSGGQRVGTERRAMTPPQGAATHWAIVVTP